MQRIRPIMLGLVGDSATGKSTLSAGLAQILGPERVTILSADDYHKYDRRERAILGITPLHPDCNYLDILAQHLHLLRRGQPILKPVYDHSTGTFTRPEYVQPRQFVIVDGLLAFSTPQLRSAFDVKVFLDPPEELRRLWKIQRDVSKRGYTVEQVLQELERREYDAATFIRPQRRYADIVVRFTPPPGVPPEEAGGRLQAQLLLRPTLPHPDITQIRCLGLDRCILPHHLIRLRLARDEGRPVDVLEIDPDVSAVDAQELEACIWANLPGDVPHPYPETIGWYTHGHDSAHSHPLALTQVLLAYHMLYPVAQSVTSEVDSSPFEEVFNDRP